CHGAPKGDIVVGSIRFNHEELVRRGIACTKCHLNVVEGDGEAPRDRCFTCHNQPEKLERYRDTEFIHEFHVAGHNIECARCHSEIKHRLPPMIGIPTARGDGSQFTGSEISNVEIRNSKLVGHRTSVIGLPVAGEHPGPGAYRAGPSSQVVRASEGVR
ncbi:MAG TPA: cytochrome c3 family protein, partial [Candidatus Methylomirabilis sp.]|nr:cytochrome c3 family protein [Candidatus Methylomirabilis sp.]